MNKNHPWVLVGPWYRSESAGGGRPLRSTRPILQKYAASNFVNEFLIEPQHSLKFVCEDFVNKLCLDAGQVISPGTNGQGEDYLKLFLDAHNRFYVVVCELHCQAPGFPSVERSQVCEAGFVVRKWVPNVPPEAHVSIGKAMREKRQITAKFMQVTEQNRRSYQALGMQTNTPLGLINKTFTEVRDKKLAQLSEDLNQATDNLSALAAEYKVELKLQGWIAGDHPGIGAWDEVEATPQAIQEEIIPLYPLIPDPNDKTHSASSRTLWFGVVPTLNSDVDGDGNARFDDSSLYEIRCFVRRHKMSCPKKNTRRDCSGEIVWSQPTENYKIAPFFDIDGSGHKPINIKLPDFDAIKEQANRGPIGKGNNVRMITPEGSGFNFIGNGMNPPTAGSPPTGSGQICFFSIILITIIALFVLRLFLPIVVFLFQLWFLLRLKLCIPPSVSIDGGLAADLKVKGPSLQADLELGVSVELETDLGTQSISNFTQLQNLFNNPSFFDKDGTMDTELKKALIAQLDSGKEGFDDVIQAALDMSTDFSDNPVDPRLAGTLPDITDGLIYFKKVPVK